LVWKKLNLTQQKDTFTNQKKCIQNKINTKKLKPGLVAFCDIQPGNAVGLFSKERLSKGGDKIVLKSKIESKAHYAPEAAWGN